MQPVLSASVLDVMIHHDKKYPAEYSTAENCMEMQVSYLSSLINLALFNWFLVWSCIGGVRANQNNL